MRPGEIIEWAYKYSGEPVTKEKLWSSVEDRWVPIGSELMHVLVSIDDETMTWMNEKGLFHARVDDTRRGPLRQSTAPVVPRARG